ncbi:hypothetical protein ACJIZ3_017998 [Penstemon smallii]|uniref:GATA-type domain-containing protein n=1 Tax=Penstemon smallii TaxID=265156 RepID=A0ABD3SXZ1_9LAMI
MDTVKPGICWNGVTGDEEFETILNILDFPMESLEGDGFVGDWDASNLGPIPLDVLMGPPEMPHGKNNQFVPQPIDITPEQKPQLPILPSSGVHAHPHAVFQTQSPVSVLESSVRSCSGGKKPGISIPVRTRSKRARPSGTSPWLSMSPILSNKSSRKNKELQLPSASSAAANKKCTHCEITKTPQWREGPLGPKTLCNACGVRYRSGRLFPEYRPAASPTFVPKLHSNSHKKVIEMRNKAKVHAATTTEEEAQMSPQPEFVPMSSYLFDLMY